MSDESFYLEDLAPGRTWEWGEYSITKDEYAPIVIRHQGLLFASLINESQEASQIKLSLESTGSGAKASHCYPDDGTWYAILSYGLPNGAVTTNYKVGPLP